MRRLLLLGLVIPGILQAQETLLGGGVRTRPEFDGARRQEADVIPVVRYYGEPWFARTTQGMLEGGVQWPAGALAAGGQITYEQGPRDRDPGASLGIHLELDRMIGRAPLNGLVRLRWHLDSDRGKQADVRMTLGVFQSGGLQAGVFGQLTVSDEENMQAYYGVDRAGLLYSAAGVLASWDIAPRWVGVASAELRRLGSDPAESALVEDRTGYYVSAGLAYRF